MISINNSLLTTTESWFIPLDILGIICNIFVIGSSIFFLFLIILDKTCHTIPMLLVANSCLIALLLEIDILSMNIFTLENDFRHIEFQDLFCLIRGYFSYSLCALYNYSYLLQSIYRYTIVVYPTRLFWQLRKTQIIFISLSWIVAFIFPLAFLFTGDIVYNIDNQICQIPFRLSFPMIYIPLCLYIIPISLIIFIYLKLVRYVRQMNKRMARINILSRAKNELKMVRRTAILATILLIIDFPYALFLFISYFTTPPKYHFRIAVIFIDFSLVAVSIALFQFTDPLKISAKKIFNNRANVIIPTLT